MEQRVHAARAEGLLAWVALWNDLAVEEENLEFARDEGAAEAGFRSAAFDRALEMIGHRF